MELHQEDIHQLIIFAEQTFCKKCQVKECGYAFTGDYEACTELMAAFEKATNEHHAFLKSMENPFVPGKCHECKIQELNDKDHNYTKVTVQHANGKIYFHGWVCSAHLKALEDTWYIVTKHGKVPP